jgi:uncharacterized membrane protein YqjE
MATRMPDTDEQSQPQQIGHTVAEISEKASLLVREEIELAKAEVSQKVKVLGKGAVVAAIAGVMAVFGLIYFFHFVAIALADFVFDDRLVWGYGVVTLFLFVMAAIAGMLGLRWIKKGSPPTPAMAIDEAKRIKETVSS